MYLCVFDGDDEVEGVEVGSYADFGAFRDTVKDELEEGGSGSRFPVFMSHSDCDGEWSPAEAVALRTELETISEELAGLPPCGLRAGWQQAVARSVGLSPENLRDCFFDVDGEPLIDRLMELCRCSAERGLPILFQ